MWAIPSSLILATWAILSGLILATWAILSGYIRHQMTIVWLSRPKPAWPRAAERQMTLRRSRTRASPS
jgi:hypothetical protein